MSPKGPRTPKSRRAPQGARVEFVHQLLIVLGGTAPLVWRRIQVPEPYSFWDLHVAIQDAMGWLDSHLHEFAVVDPASGLTMRVGIPDPDEPGQQSVLPGWDVPVTDYLVDGAPPALYTYDFGDDWHHVVFYEGTSPAETLARYPQCVAGAGACPPEDSGGPHRYAELVAALADPTHPEHDEMREWAGRDFEPERFDPATVSFDDPKMRRKQAFGR